MTNKELDILVAEKVLGIVPCDQWYHSNMGAAGGPVLIHRGECGHKKCYPPHLLKEGRRFGWCYSTDIRDAWEVVENHPDPDYFTDIMGDLLSIDIWSLPAGDAAWLICNVALQAVGIDIDTDDKNTTSIQA